MKRLVKPRELLVGVSLILAIANLGHLGCGRPVTVPVATEVSVAKDNERALPRPSDRSETVRKVLAALESGDLEHAERWSQSLILETPREPDVIFLMARVLAAKKRYQEAVELLNELPENASQARLAALGQSADWMLLAANWKEAERRFIELLSRVPTADHVRRRLAQLLNRQGRRQEAAEHLRELCRRGNFEETELLALITISHGFAAESEQAEFGPIGALGKARLEFSNGRWETTIRLLEQDSPYEDPAAAALLGRAYAEIQDHDSLQQWASRVPVGAKEFADYWLAMGTQWLIAENAAAATVALGEAILLDPTDKIAYVRFSQALQQLGYPAAADQALARSTLLVKSNEISNRFKKNGLRSGEDLSQMAAVLEQLQRPFEAIAWRAFHLGLSNTSRESHESERQLLLSELNQRRQELLSISPETPSTFLLCGIGLKDIRVTLKTLPMAPLAPTAYDVTAKKSMPTAILVPAVFSDVASQLGITMAYDNGAPADSRSLIIPEETGGGVAVLDYDLDGRVDLYFMQAAGIPMQGKGTKPNVLYRNLGNRMVDVTTSAQSDDRGFGQGATAGDLDQDGFPELLAANIGPNRLFRNHGDGTFSPAPLNEQPPLWTTSVALGDVNGDHLPDIVEVNFIDDPKALTRIEHEAAPRLGPSHYRRAPDRVFLSKGDGSFTPIRLIGDDEELASTGLGVVLTDFDDDRVNEIFIANDGLPNHYWVRQPQADQEVGQQVLLPAVAQAEKHTFVLRELARLKGCAVGFRGDAQACMGVAAADLNGDGLLDLHVTNFYNEPNNLFLQTPSGMFVDAGAKFGIELLSLKLLGFGTQAIDYDNNGDWELAILNGHVWDLRHRGEPFKMLPQLLQLSNWDQYHEVKVSDASHYWSTPTLGRALAKLDWNRDGLTDLVATHLDHSAALIENRTSSKSNWLQLRLVGTESERDAMGAKVTVSTDDKRWVQTVNAGDGYFCKNESILSFGLGEAALASVEILWPSGKRQSCPSIPIPGRILIVEGRQEWYFDAAKKEF